ncbi:MAG: PQQ-dependent sugar dehydrogenase, partial [Gemmatimonadaceae bacterium]
MKVRKLERKLAGPARAIAATAAALGTIAIGAAFLPAGANANDPAATSASVARSRAPKCEEGNGGITIPTGFCATIFADKLGAARHPVVLPNGDVYIAMQPRRTGASATAGVSVLRDTDGDGKADKIEYFGPYGGGGIALKGNFLYLDARSAILRYTLTKGVMVPTGAPDTIVSGLPATGNHFSREIALDGKGNMFVNVGSSTNVCQPGSDLSSKGADPCVELETRAGVWKFSDSQIGQKFTPAARYVTGLRNAVGLAWNPKDNSLYSTQHGRDSFVQAFPALYDQKKSAENPAEEFMKLQPGDDFGWPYCYYDNDLKRLVLAPEYGGDAKMPGRCATKKLPVAAFPGHWAPNALEFYSGTQFPVKYRDGAFIAFHGSWNRAP